MAPKNATELALVRSIAPADKVADDAHERRMCGEYARMFRGVKCRPGGRRRWLADKAIAGTYRPHASPQEMMDGAIEAGASFEDVVAWMAPLRARAVALIAKRDGTTLPHIRDCIRRETAAQHAFDAPQLEVMANPTRPDLLRIITEGTAQIDATQACVDRAAIELRAMDEARGDALGRLGVGTGRAS